MGLGKTLSMLAAIVASLERAFEYAFNSTMAPIEYWSEVTPSKSTLVLVPSARKFSMITCDCFECLYN